MAAFAPPIPAAPAPSAPAAPLSAREIAINAMNSPGGTVGTPSQTPATPQVGASSAPTLPNGAPIVPPTTPEPTLDDNGEFDFDAPVDPATGQPSVSTEGAGAEGAATGTEPDPLDQLRESLAKEALSAEEEDKLRGVFLKTPNGRKMLEAKQLRAAVEAPPEIDPETGLNKGGLGRWPTKDELLEMDQQALNVLQMNYDFEHNPDNWMANFFGYRDASGQLQVRPGAETVLDKLPEHLLKIDPQGQIHSQIAAKFITPYLDRLRTDVANLPQTTREQADEKLRRGQGLNDLEMTLLGKITPIPGFDYGSGPTDPNRPDPLAAERQRLAAEAKRIEDQKRANYTAQVTAIANDLETTIESTVRSDALKYLESKGLSKSAYPALVYDEIVNKFLTQVFAATSGDSRMGTRPLNPRGFQQYRSQFDQATTGRLDRNLPVTSYRRMAQEAIVKLTRPFLESVTSKTTNEEAHRRAAAAAGRTEPASHGAPAGAPPVAAQPLTRPAGMDYDEWTRKTVMETMLAR